MSSPKDYKSRIDSKLPRRKIVWLKPALFIILAVITITFVINQFSSGTPTPEAASIDISPDAPKRVTLSLPLPSLTTKDSTEPSTRTAPKSPIKIAPQSSRPTTLERPLKQLHYIVKSGDSLSTIFSALDLSKRELHEITHSGPTSRALKALRPRKKLSIYVSGENKIERLIYEKNHIDSIIVSRTEKGFTVAEKSKKIERHQAAASATIQSSLFNDAKKAGIADKTIMELANIFGWDIDFALDLRKGDHFSILYEKRFIEGEEISAGAILAAEFTSRNKTFQAVRYTNPKGRSNYFTPKGNSMRKAFLRTPVDFARISSRFNLKRKHPVLNRIRAHKGVDYAASTGTPIKTTGDGRIIFRGRKGGYGRVVIIQHGQRYTTLYAHLSKFHHKRRNGSYVKQGQTIGYVGKSGLASGPHLHYEFRVNGVHRNPLTVSLPHATPIAKKYLAEFKKQTSPLVSQLERTKTVRLAQAGVQNRVNP